MGAQLLALIGRRTNRFRILGGAAQMYTLRQMQELEQFKNEEIEKMREQMQRYLVGKEAEMRAQIEAVSGERADYARLAHENQVLKHGIRAQQAAAERQASEAEAGRAGDRATFMRAAAEAAEHIRRLENHNYTLRLQLQQMAPASLEGTEGRPQWGKGY